MNKALSTSSTQMKSLILKALPYVRDEKLLRRVWKILLRGMDARGGGAP